MERSTDYKYYSFDSDNSILYHEVRNENFGDRASFIISLSYFITLIEEFNPEKLIITIRKEPDYFEMELSDFMHKALYSTILHSGIEKVAFYVTDEKYFYDLKKYERDDSV